MTIEHIAPQSEIGNGDFTDYNIGQLGNLILVSEELNNKLDNKGFKDKIKILNSEGYTLDPDISNSANWTPIEIKNRTQSLADFAYNHAWKF